MNDTNFIPADLEEMLDRAEAEMREMRSKGQKPEDKGQQYGMRKPKAEEQNTVRKPEAEKRRPEAGGRKPEAEKQKPEAEKQKPEMRKPAGGKESGKKKSHDDTTPSGTEYPVNDIDFRTRFRGYDRGQVADYVNALTEDYNKICARCEELEKENEQLRAGTDAIGTAILKAEAMARQIIAQAEADAQNIRAAPAPVQGFPAELLSLNSYL